MLMFIERLIKSTDGKHTIHYSNVGGIPIIERLVKFSMRKHSFHICYSRSIPMPNWLVEITISKHVRCIGFCAAMGS